MQKDRIISALIGLVGACNNNPKTENTDHIVLKALAFPAENLESSEDAFQNMMEEIYKEKNAVAPGCATCAMPCGNTSDYDMSRIYNAKEEIRKTKLKILAELQELAVSENPVSDTEIFYKALSYVSYDMEKEALLILLEELVEMKKKSEEI